MADEKKKKPTVVAILCSIADGTVKHDIAGSDQLEPWMVGAIVGHIFANGEIPEAEVSMAIEAIINIIKKTDDPDAGIECAKALEVLEGGSDAVVAAWQKSEKNSTEEENLAALAEEMGIELPEKDDGE